MTRRLVERAEGAGYEEIVLTADVPLLANRNGGRAAGLRWTLRSRSGTEATSSPGPCPGPGRGLGPSTRDDHRRHLGGTGGSRELDTSSHRRQGGPNPRGCPPCHRPRGARDHRLQPWRPTAGRSAGRPRRPPRRPGRGAWDGGGLPRWRSPPGTDVVLALALGARAVGIGQPVLWALAVGGSTGVSGCSSSSVRSSPASWPLPVVGRWRS